MGSIERIMLAIVGVAMATTLLLPGRQTAGVIKAGGQAFQGGLFTAITGKK